MCSTKKARLGKSYNQLAASCLQCKPDYGAEIKHSKDNLKIFAFPEISSFILCTLRMSQFFIDLNSFKAAWFCSCFLKWSNFEKLLSHFEHLKGFSPVWVLSCFFKLRYLKYIFPSWLPSHMRHFYWSHFLGSYEKRDN